MIYTKFDYPIKAGDRSLANVIAHEIAHSWTGNLVTNSNFEHFWLNEGFTVFTERKIAGRMEGEASRHFGGLNGWKDLKEEVGELLFRLNKLALLSFIFKKVYFNFGFIVIILYKSLLCSRNIT